MTKQYLALLEDILENGIVKEDRTGTGTLSVFGRQARWDLSEGFPLLTTKKLFMKGITHELLWFIRGETNLDYLHKHNVHFWDEWATEDGELGPIYGKQWRSWPATDGRTIDQLSEVIETLKTRPDDRRMIISSWNVGEVDYMALPPCHLLFQFWVGEEGKSGKRKLSCQLYQRSCDTFLGVPFNIASYAMFTHMMAQVTDLEPGEFIHTYGDLHLYRNHLKQAKKQLTRTPGPLPKLELTSDIKNIEDFTYEDIKIVDYEAQPHIKAPISV